jgi:hypothetical protein
MGFIKVDIKSNTGTAVALAENGLSVINPAPGVFIVVLGQDVGQVGNPAIFLSDRELPTAGFDLVMTGNGNLLTDGNIGIDQPAPAANIHIGNGAGLAHILMQATNNVIDMQGNTASLFFTANAGTIRTSQVNMEISQPSTMGVVGSYHWIRFNNPNHMQTSGNGIGISSIQEFRPPSGTATFAVIEFDDVIDQTTGATGITRTIFIAPVLLSPADYRALEVGNNLGYAVLQTGASAINSFNGRSGFGVLVPTARIHTAAQTAAANTAPIKLTLSATVMTTPEIGAIEGQLEFPTFTPTTGPTRRPFMLLTGTFTADRIPFVNAAATGFDTTNNFRYSTTSTSLGIAATPSSNAFLVLGAGGTVKAPYRYTAGPVQTVVVDGSKEFDGTNEFVSVGGVRYTLAKTLIATASLNFPNTVSGTSSDLTITVTGAADGDPVLLGIPAAAAADIDCCYTAFVSAANTVTVRFNNYGAGAVDPAIGTFRVSIVKYT